ncbi:hypothetical protein LUZ61_011164 [Rhynchospora tenuis]|uniref:F-box domain-containing protein n=1 Tax=Rhynchospora tenuis TaxID=198213 RepID=A0AAD6A0U3_9POAL|nr:hypothetical protein LUZ61_011164 [Rhynchospora tenuis]
MEKKPHVDGGAPPVELVERLPQALLVEILSRLDLYSLCSAAPVCRTLNASASQALSSISSLDLSGFSPTVQILSRILGGNDAIQNLALDCSRLDDSSFNGFAKKSLVELSLLKCSAFSPSIFAVIGERCPNLRHFSLDMASHVKKKDASMAVNNAIIQMLHGCLQLESLCLKFPLQHPGTFYFHSFWLALPKTIKSLILQPVSNRQARIPISGNTQNAAPNYVGLHSLSLVLDVISDELVLSITSNLPNLAELCLEDNPPEQPALHEDLTNNGFQFLSFCHNLIRLYLTRDKQWAFQRVNDMGLLLLAEGCKKLESVRLGGFSKVTDAGYASLIHSCKNLKRFEVTHALFLSDLAFHDLANLASSLAEVRLVSCNLLTSETAVSLSSCRNLGVLNLSVCRSIADAGLASISNLQNLTTLDLGGADITDAGLSALAGTSSPISSLCLRGCKRITDNGICQIFHANTIISLNISTLDLGYLPRVTDRAIKVISESCKKITRLCLRSCFYVTDTSITRLGSVDRFASGASVIRMLDLTHCNGISADALRLFDRPYFRGLHWLGIGSTRMVPRGNGRIIELLEERPGLKICKDSCEMGCKNEWQYHS